MPAVAVISGSSLTPGKKNGFSCRLLIAATTSGSRAHSTDVEPARRATMASAVPQAPPPMIANRLIVSRLNPGSRPRWCGGIERPTWPKRRVKTIYEAEAKPLQPRPGDHRPVVGTQRRRRRHKAQPRISSERRKAPSQLTIGCDAARCNQALPLRVTANEPGDGVCRPIGQRIADGAFDGGGEIGPITWIEAPKFGGDLTHRGFQSGEREITTGSALQRTRQDETGAITFVSGSLDRRPARIAEPHQLCRLVESLSGCIVERSPEAGIASNTAADEELTIPTGDQQEQVGEGEVIREMGRQRMTFEMV